MSKKPDLGDEEHAKLVEALLLVIGFWSAAKFRFVGVVALTGAAAFYPQASLAAPTRSAIYVSLALAGSATIATIFRRAGTPHWSDPRLRSVLRLEVLLTSELWVIFGLLATGSVGPLPLFVLYGLTAIGEALVASEVRRRVGRKTRTYYVKQLPIGDSTVGAVAKRLAKDFSFPPFSWIAAFFKRRPRVSLYATIFIFTLTSLAAANGFAAFIVAPDIQHGPKNKQVPAPHRHRLRHSTPPSTSVPANLTTPSGSGLPSVSTNASSTSPTPAPLTWEQLCGTLPGFDAPEWARATAYGLLLGNGGPGANVAGCTGTTRSLPSTSDFIYLVGRDQSGTARSVTVVARDTGSFPPAVFLAPAADGALRLIAQDGPIGGSPRFDVAVGDAQFAYSSEGTTVFMRTTKVLPGSPEYAAPYVELPPAVSEEWYADVVASREWLWVSVAPNDPATGRQKFIFTTSKNKTTVAKVEFDTASREAFVTVGGRVMSHAADGRQITLADTQAATR